MKSIRTIALAIPAAALVVLTAAAGFVVFMLVSGGSPNPTSTTTVEHDHATLLARLQDQSRYTAASQHLQTVVDVEQKPDHLPSGIIGSRSVLVAEGDVDASVDFSELTTEAVDVSADGRSVVVHLPPPTLSAPRIDPTKSSVVSRERGLVDRVADAVSGSAHIDDQKLYVEAQQKLAHAAEEGELVDRAENNTEAFVRDLYGSMGYDRVTVLFDRPQPGAAA